jgi:hypothetical protein
MAKTHSDKSNETIEKLQLHLIEVEAQLNNPIPDDPFDFAIRGRRKLEHERDVIKEQIAFLQKNKLGIQQAKTTSRRKRSPTKQETVYKRVEALQKRHPNLTKTRIFSKLSDSMADSTEEAIKKAYYAQSAKADRERKAKLKRDSEVKSDQKDQGERLSPKK